MTSNTENWKNVKLKDVCRLINGRAYKKKELLDEGKYPVLRVGNFFSNRSWYYSDLELQEDKYCDSGDLLYAWSASFGPRIWEGGKVIYHYHIWKTELDLSKILKKYLFHWFDWDTEKIKKEQGAGTTMIHVTKGSMEDRVLPLPSLPEQERIVTILDEAFEGIDKAIANTEKNLANARELFDSYLNNIFTQNCEGWEETTLGKIASFKNGLNFSKSSKGEIIRIVGVKDFQKNHIVPVDQLDKIQIDGDLSKDYELQSGDILTVRSNGNKELIGRCMLVNGMTDKTSYSGFTIRIRCHNPKIIPSFLVHYLKSGSIHKMLTNNGGGVNISNLNQKMLSALPVIIPSKNDQLQLIDNIETMICRKDELITIYQQKLTALQELKQSILQKAFTGELTKDSTAH